MNLKYNWIYDIYDLNMKLIGTIGSTKHIPKGEIFVVNENMYKVKGSYYSKHTDFNSDLTVEKIGSINVVEQLYLEQKTCKL